MILLGELSTLGLFINMGTKYSRGYTIYECHMKIVNSNDVILTFGIHTHIDLCEELVTMKSICLHIVIVELLHA